MIKLFTSDIIGFVRAAIDELQPNSSLMELLTDADSQDLDHIIEANILKAVNVIHSTAPHILAAKDADSLSQEDNVEVDGKTILIHFTEKGLLRPLALAATDSNYTVTEFIPEDSLEAAKQNDPYVCGTYQRPAVVLRYGDNGPYLQYYSLREAPGVSASGEDYVRKLLYFPIPKIETEDNKQYVSINRYLENAILSYLTGLVLATFKDQNAETYFNLAKAHLT